MRSRFFTTAIVVVILTVGSPRAVLAASRADAPPDESSAATKPTEEASQEVVVRGARTDAPAHVLSGEEARSTPGTSGDPFRVIESLPGVTPVMWPAAIYTVRGSNPGQTGYFIDGLRVPALFHFALGPSVVHPYLVDGVDFYPGVYPARYGGYASGIVAARTLSPPPDRVRASVDLRLYDAGALVSVPIADGSLLFAGRYSFAGPVLSLLSDTSVGYYDYQARYDQRLGAGKLTVFAMGSFDEMSSEVYPDLNAEQQFHRVDLRWASRLGAGRLETSFAFGYDKTRSHLFQLPFEVQATSFAPRLGYRLPLGKLGLLEFGNDFSVQHFEPKTEGYEGKLNDLASPRTAWSNAAYVSMALQPSQDLTITPALRIEEFVQGGGVAVAPVPRIFARYRALPPLWLKASAGRSVQMPSVPVGIAGMESFGLAQYGLQSSLGGSVGAEAEVFDWFDLDVTAFANKMRVTDIRSTVQLSTILRENYFETRNARSYGVETMLVRRAHHALSGTLSYTLSFSERQVDYVYGPSDWDQRHVLNLVLNQRLGRGFALGGRFHFHTGRIVTVEQDYLLTAAVGRRRLPAFHQLDLRLEKKWELPKVRLYAYVECANLLATRQVYGYKLEQSVPGDDSNKTVVEQSYRIVLPSLGFRAEL